MAYRRAGLCHERRQPERMSRAVIHESPERVHDAGVADHDRRRDLLSIGHANADRPPFTDEDSLHLGVDQQATARCLDRGKDASGDAPGPADRVAGAVHEVVGQVDPEARLGGGRP